MKSSQLRKFYLAFIYYYGAIYSDDAYKIIKGFYPDFKEETLLNDLKKRVGKMTRQYMVLETDDDRYVISNDLFNDDDLDELFYQQGNKPFFVENDLDRYLDEFGVDLPKEYDNLQKYLDKHIKIKDKKMREQLTDIYQLMFFTRIRNSLGGQSEINDMIQEALDLCGIEDLNKANDLIKHIMEAYNNTPMITNRGYSPIEMRKKEGPVDLSNLQIQMDDNMKHMMLDGELDAQEMLEQIRNADLPEMMKNSLIEQLEKVIMMKNNTGKA